MQDEHACCGAQHEGWMPEPLLVPNGETTIDIAPTLADKNDPYSSLRKQQDSLRVVFSADIYPPLWDRRQKIEHAIIIAAAETNNPLIRTGTNLIDGKKAHHVSILSCKFSKPYQPDKKQKDPHTVDENSVPQYREGVRIPLWERKLKIGLMGSENLAELSQENLRQQKSVIFTCD